MQLPHGSRVRVLGSEDRPVHTDLLAWLTGELATCAVVEVPEALAPLGLLDAQGISSDGEEGLRRLSFKPLPPLVVLTGLEAPEPMHRILAAVAALKPGETFLALLPHRPAPLLPLLDARGVEYDLALRPDGRALLWLTRGTT